MCILLSNTSRWERILWPLWDVHSWFCVLIVLRFPLFFQAACQSPPDLWLAACASLAAITPLWALANFHHYLWGQGRKVSWVQILFSDCHRPACFPGTLGNIMIRDV